MQLIAKKSFPYGGTRVNPGDPFNASKKDAALLVHVKYAEYQGMEEKPQEKKQDYKRQNMVAEQSSKPKKEAKTPAKKREYKRRDMKADD